jgi:hypothetical protein
MISYPQPEYKREGFVVNYEFRSIPELSFLTYIGTTEDEEEGDYGYFAALESSDMDRFTSSTSSRERIAWELSVSNNSSEVKDVILFGANRNILKPNFGNDESISVLFFDSNTEQRTYVEMMERTQLNPFTCGLLRINDQDYKNFDHCVNLITVTTRDANGMRLVRDIDPNSSSIISAYGFSTSVRDIAWANIPMVGNTEITLNVKPNSKVRVSFFEPINLLSNRVIIPFPTI